MQLKRRVGGVVGMWAADKFSGRHCVVCQQQPLGGKVVCLPLRGPKRRPDWEGSEKSLSLHGWGLRPRRSAVASAKRQAPGRAHTLMGGPCASAGAWSALATCSGEGALGTAGRPPRFIPACPSGSPQGRPCAL